MAEWYETAAKEYDALAAGDASAPEPVAETPEWVTQAAKEYDYLNAQGELGPVGDGGRLAYSWEATKRSLSRIGVVVDEIMASFEDDPVERTRLDALLNIEKQKADLEYQDALKGISPEILEEASKEWLTTEDSAFLDPGAWLTQLGGSMGSSAVLIGVPILTSIGGGLVGGPAGAAVGGGVGIAAAGAGEGAITAGELFDQARERIMLRPHEELLKDSPMYRQYIEEGMSEQEARQTLFDSTKKYIAAAGTITAALGMVGAGKIVNPLTKGVKRKMLKGVAEGAIGEGVTEAGQGATEYLAGQAIAEKDPTLHGVAEAAVSSGILGGMMGGGLGGVTAGLSRNRVDPDVAAALSETTPPTQTPPGTAPEGPAGPVEPLGGTRAPVDPTDVTQGPSPEAQAVAARTAAQIPDGPVQGPAAPPDAGVTAAREAAGLTPPPQNQPRQPLLVPRAERDWPQVRPLTVRGLVETARRARTERARDMEREMRAVIRETPDDYGPPALTEPADVPDVDAARPTTTQYAKGGKSFKELANEVLGRYKGDVEKHTGGTAKLLTPVINELLRRLDGIDDPASRDAFIETLHREYGDSSLGVVEGVDPDLGVAAEDAELTVSRFLDEMAPALPARTPPVRQEIEQDIEPFEAVRTVTVESGRRGNVVRTPDQPRPSTPVPPPLPETLPEPKVRKAADIEAEITRLEAEHRTSLRAKNRKRAQTKEAKAKRRVELKERRDRIASLKKELPKRKLEEARTKARLDKTTQRLERERPKKKEAQTPKGKTSRQLIESINDERKGKSHERRHTEFLSSLSEVITTVRDLFEAREKSASEDYAKQWEDISKAQSRATTIKAQDKAQLAADSLTAEGSERKSLPALRRMFKSKLKANRSLAEQISDLSAKDFNYLLDVLFEEVSVFTDATYDTFLEKVNEGPYALQSWLGDISDALALRVGAREDAQRMQQYQIDYIKNLLDQKNVAEARHLLAYDKLGIAHRLPTQEELEGMGFSEGQIEQVLSRRKAKAANKTERRNKINDIIAFWREKSEPYTAEFEFGKFPIPPAVKGVTPPWTPTAADRARLQRLISWFKAERANAHKKDKNRYDSMTKALKEIEARMAKGKPERLVYAYLNRSRLGKHMDRYVSLPLDWAIYDADGRRIGWDSDYAGTVSVAPVNYDVGQLKEAALEATKEPVARTDSEIDSLFADPAVERRVSNRHAEEVSMLEQAAAEAKSQEAKAALEEAVANLKELFGDGVRSYAYKTMPSLYTAVSKRFHPTKDTVLNEQWYRDAMLALNEVRGSKTFHSLYAGAAMETDGDILYELDTRRGEISARELLQYIADSLGDTPIRSVYNDLVRAMPKDILVKPEVTYDGETRARGSFDLRDDTIRLDPTFPTGQTVTLAHEAIHAISAKQLRTDKAFRDTIQNLFDRARAAQTEGLFSYELKDLDEFLSGAFTNPDFMQFLKTVTVQQLNLWQRFVQAIKSTFGFSAPESVMDALLDVNVFDPLKIYKATQKYKVSRLADAEVGPLYSLLSLGTDKQGNTIADRLSAMGAALPKNLRDTLTFLNLKTRTLDQIAWKYDKLFSKYVASGSPLAAYAKRIFRRAGDIAEHGRPFDKLVDRYHKLGTEYGHDAIQNFYDLAEQSTRLEMDPTLPFSHSVHDHLRVDSRGKALSSSEVQKNSKSHKSLSDQYDALNPDFKQLWKDTQALFKSRHQEMMDYLMLQAAETIVLSKATTEMDPDAVTEDAQDIVDRHKRGDSTLADDIGEANHELLGRVAVKAKIRGSYFPLRRFGNYVLLLDKTYSRRMSASQYRLTQQKYPDFEIERDTNAGPNMYTIRVRSHMAFNSRSDAELARARAGKLTYSFGTVEPEHFEIIKREDIESTQAGTPTPALVSRMIANIEDSKGLSPTEREAMKSHAKMMAMELLPDTSIMKSFMRREGRSNLTGHDMVRSISQYGMASSRYIGKLRHKNHVMGMLRDLKNSTDAARGTDDYDTMLQVYEELHGRELRDDQYHHLTSAMEWSKLGTDVGYLYMMSSASTITVNMTQPFVTTLPYLSGKYGAAQSSAALTRAYAMIGRSTVSSIRENLFKYGDRGRFDMMDSAKSAIDAFFATARDLGYTKGDIYALLEYLDKHEAMSMTMNVELAATGRGQDTIRNKINEMIAYPAHVMEVMNRAVTAIAAYDLAVNNGMDKKAAREFARESVMHTQFNYIQEMRPEWMKSAWGRLMTQFRIYSLGMIHLTLDLINTVATNPAERAAAGKQLAVMAGVLMAMGGTNAIMFQPAVMLFNGAAALMGLAIGQDDETIQDEIERFLRKELGEEALFTLQKGPLAALGIDLSDRIGLHNILYMDRYRGEGSAAMYGLAGETLLGPAITRGVAAIDGIIRHGYGQGNWVKAGEAVMPKFLKDIVKGGRYAVDGLTDTRGRDMLPDDPVSIWNATTQMIGFSPSKISQAYERRQDLKDLQAHYSKVKQSIIDAYYNADTAAERQAVIDRLREWNRKNPRATITRADLIRGLRGRRLYQREMRGGVSIKTRERRKLEAELGYR